MQTKAVAAQSEVTETTGKCRVRARSGGYASALFVLTFVAALLAHLNFEIAGLILLGAAWTIVPALGWFDRIEFDGKSLTRTGAVAQLSRLLGRQPRLKIADVEAVETNSLRALRRGGAVYYRYRCEIYGDGQSFVFAAGGKAFRQMVRQVFAQINQEKLDVRSLELRDFLIEPKALTAKVKKFKLPSSDVLENVLPQLRRARNRSDDSPKLLLNQETRFDSEQKTVELQQIANELRVAGNLAQSLEAFRHALRRQPDNARLLYEFARGLHSYAGATRSRRWLQRALAALRLAAKRADADHSLLTRIGETYFQYGDFPRAAETFRRALATRDTDANTDANAGFRAECGLAEVGLQSGKIAHVVHYYQEAARIAPDEAARQWARREAEYFALLTSDADYMDAEVARIGWAANFESSKRIGWRLTFIGLVTALIGAALGEPLDSIGWAIAATAIMVWLISLVAEKFLAERFPKIEEDDEP